MRRLVLALLGLAFVLLMAASVAAQPPAAGDADRKAAMDLYDQNKLVEALPLLEKLAVGRPDDVVVHERLGICLAGAANGAKDPDERKKLVLRARAALLRAKELGDNSNLLQIVLDQLPEDGVVAGFSSRAEVDDVMKSAETDFTRGALDQALAKYARALELDPTLYQAALFAGDTCFKQGKHDDAGEWFARAIRIDPNRESAYRYWGDSLMAAGRMSDARVKFIEAVIAEPYGSAGRIGLTQWADRNSMQFHVLQLKSLGSVTSDGGKTTITINADALGKKGAAATASLLYGGVRIQWQREKFKQQFPNEAAYRHTLKEEAEALGTVADVVARERDDTRGGGKKNLDPELAGLVQIRDEGLLEAYILLFRSDAGIAQDYAAYRATNREKLFRLMDEFVVPRLPQKR